MNTKHLTGLLCALAFAAIPPIAADESTEIEYRQQTVKLQLKELFTEAGLIDELKTVPRVYEKFIENKASIKLHYTDRVEKAGYYTLLLHSADSSSGLANTRGVVGSDFTKEYVGQLGSFVFSPMKKQHTWYLYVFSMRNSKGQMSISIPFYCEVERPLGKEPRIKEFGVFKERALFIYQEH